MVCVTDGRIESYAESLRLPLLDRRRLTGFWRRGDPTPRVQCVNAVDKGVSGRIEVNAVDKGLICRFCLALDGAWIRVLKINELAEGLAERVTGVLHRRRGLAELAGSESGMFTAYDSRRSTAGQLVEVPDSVQVADAGDYLPAGVWDGVSWGDSFTKIGERGKAKFPATSSMTLTWQT